ncbi:PEP-CTERM sorting domain-containing protein [Sandaracinobacter sp.]|uniref:PEP-CTERM sorting domain-containing protein n=1 Tax=Sandaracinobacter sp. TaxID=2487581 RepID=UPI0035B05A18
MIGTKEICALLLAGSMGAGSVVAVQKAKPAVSRQRPATKPKVQKATQSQVQTASITECPTVGPVGSPDLSPIIAMETTEPLTGFRQTAAAPFGGGGGSGGGIGGGKGPSILPDPSPTPGIPQPDTWVMLVAGFGFMGLALRRRPRVDKASS